MGRSDARRSGSEQPRDRAGRFGRADYPRAEDVSLDAPLAGINASASAVLRDQGQVSHASARQAEGYEPVELPEGASALDRAIAEAQLTGIWVARPRGPVGTAVAA